jgi:hypothetical protein
MKINYEFRTNKIRYGSPKLMESPDRQYTYRSLYGYGPETTKMIETNGNTRGLKGQPVFSDLIIIDCDTGEEGLVVQNRLEALGVNFEQWLTGNRGCHFHIPIEPMYGTDVIWSQTLWLTDIGLWDVIDTSIYREGGQIRVPGAVHEKTGRVKEKVRTVEGDKPRIPIKKQPNTPVQSNHVPGTPEAKEEYRRNLLYRRSEGGRHTHMYILWRRGIEAGLDLETIKEDIRKWNEERAEPSHLPHIVEAKIRGFRA